MAIDGDNSDDAPADDSPSSGDDGDSGEATITDLPDGSSVVVLDDGGPPVVIEPITVN